MIYNVAMNIDELKINLRGTKRTEEANKVLAAYLTALNITSFSFTYYAHHPKSSDKLKYDFASKNLQQWHDQFIKENYDYIDTTLDELYQRSLPLFWRYEDQIKNAKTEKEKQMRQNGQQLEVECGLSIPLHGPGNDFACLMVQQLKEQTCLLNWEQCQDEIFIAGLYYFQTIKRLLIRNTSEATGEELSAREVQILTLTAQQHSVAQIAQQLFITERTVNYHIQKINKKFGAKNKYQSVTIATEKGLLLL